MGLVSVSQGKCAHLKKVPDRTYPHGLIGRGSPYDNHGVFDPMRWPFLFFSLWKVLWLDYQS